MENYKVCQRKVIVDRRRGPLVIQVKVLSAYLIITGAISIKCKMKHSRRLRLRKLLYQRPIGFLQQFQNLIMMENVIYGHSINGKKLGH